MASIANLLVSLGANFGDTDSQFKNLRDHLKGTGDEAEKAKEHLKHLGEGGEEAGGGVEKLKEMFSELGKELIKFGAEAVALTSVFEVLKESVEVAAAIETVSVAMEVFTGSAEKTRETIEELEGVAKSEALNFPQILPAAQHMMALGFSAEQVVNALKAAGNASWALGTPLESVSQRMAMMAMSGMANNRMLRSLGISAKELGAVMGVAGDDVSKAFKGMDEESRLEALMEAMDKFKDVAAKEAETVSGKWIEVKNTWHEVFGSMGESMEPVTLFLENFAIGVADLTKEVIEDLRAMGAEFPILAHLVVTAGQLMTDSLKLISDAFSNDKNIDALKILMEAQRKNITYAEASKQAHAAAITGPEASKEDKDRADKLDEDRKKQEAHDKMVADSLKAMGPIRAKEAAAGILAEIANEERGNSEFAALQRQRMELAIGAEHAIVTQRIDLMRDPVARARAMAEEEIRVANERKERIGAIDQAEHDKRNILLQRKIAPEIAAKYAPGPTGEPDPAKAALDAQAVRFKVAGEIAKSDSDLALKQIKSVESVEKANQKSASGSAIEWRKSAEKAVTDWEKAFDAIDKAGQQTQDAINKATEKRIPVDVAAQKIATTDTSQARKAQDITTAQIAMERAYGLQIITTAQQRIAYQQALGELEAKSLDLKTTGLQIDLAVAQAAFDATGTTEDQRKVEELTLALKEAQWAADNKRFETETKILGLKQQENSLLQIEKGFAVAGGRVTGGLAGGLAGGIFHEGKGGMDVGRQVAEAMRNIGKDLLGDIFKQTIHQLIVTLGLNTLVTTSNTGAISIHAGVMISHMGTMIAHGAIMLWHGLTVIANTIAVHLLAIIEAVKTFFGFAEGGAPPLNVPSLVGEKGPELFVPTQAGIILPNNMLGGKGQSSTSTSSSIGEVHFHINGAQHPREVARQVASYLKTANPKFSPAAR